MIVDYEKIHSGSELVEYSVTHDDSTCMHPECNSDGVTNLLYGIGAIVSKLTKSPISKSAFDKEILLWKNFKDIFDLTNYSTDPDAPPKLREELESVEHFTNIVTEICDRVCNKAVEWFEQKYSNQLTRISESKINKESIEKIEKEINRLINNIQSEYIALYDSELSYMGFPVTCIRKMDDVPDCKAFVQNSLVEMIKWIAKELHDLIIIPKEQPVQIPMQQPAVPVAQPQQPMQNFVGTPLYPQPSFISYDAVPTQMIVPVYQDVDINRHFVISDPVYVQDINQANALGAILKDIALRLDYTDQQILGLKTPSKFGIVQFNDFNNWIAILLDESNNWVSSNDMAYQEIRVNPNEEPQWCGPTTIIK